MRAELTFLGRTTFTDALARQREAHARLVEGTGPPTILVTEHESVYTVGRGGVKRRFGEGDPARYPSVRDSALEVVELHRGGDVAWHGPGQVVVYPVLPLKRLGLSLIGYLRALERAGVDALGSCGVAAYTRKRLTGIWTRTPDGGHGKVGFIGVGCRRWITYHGLALNVSCDLAPFGRIVPCGIEGVRVTRVADLLPDLDREPPSIECLGREVARSLAAVCGLALAEAATSWREKVICE